MPRKRKEELEREISEGKINKPHQRFAANARERSRMRVLSKAFSRLKTTLPWVPPDTKLSKLDTLRLASSYIAHLKQILDHEETMHAQGTFIHPLNLTWPFTFSSRTFGSSPSSPHSTTNNNSKCNNDNNKVAVSSNNNTINNNNNNNNINKNNNNSSNNNNRTNSCSKTAVAGMNSNTGVNTIQSNHFGILDTYCNGSLSPISDTSSLNEHEIVSQS